MTDYYPLIARAVAGLEKNTGEARRALYERARNALVAQLRSLTPPLTESEITRERLALEEAVRKIEAESARRARVEVPRAAAGGAAAAAAPAVAVRPAEAPQVEEPPAPEPAEPDPASARLPAAAPIPPVAAEAPQAEEQPAPPPPLPPQPEPVRAPMRLRVRERERAPQPEEGIKGLRDVVAEAETLGEATAQAARSAREAYSAVPASAPELDRLEPRMEPPGLRTPRERPREKARDRDTPRDRTAAPPPREKTDVEAPARPADASTPPLEPAVRGSEQPSRTSESRPAPARLVAGQPASPTEAAGLALSRKGLIAAVVAVLVIVALGVGLYTQREMVSGLFNGGRNAVQAQRDAGAGRPKISDRVGQATQPSAAPAGQADAAVAQRVVLYEEDPTDPQGKRFVGSAIWRTETVSPGPGLSPELAVRADLEIPERRITMTLSLRRNTDQALPASHTIEILFNLPTDFPFGGVSNVPGILMKQAEQTRGAPLAGLAVKVTSGFFLVGLSAVDADRQRNIQLLKERSWFDVPIVFNNGRRAILAVEKGTPGERAFNDAFSTWGE